MPKGFYLILYHPPGERAAAEAFLKALAERVSCVPGLAELNHTQIKAWHTHAGISPEPIFHGIPCIIQEATDHPVPYTLITEYPDETIYDDAFRLGHTAQMVTVVEAVTLYRAGLLPTVPAA